MVTGILEQQRRQVVAEIAVTQHISIDEKELQLDFIRAAGPGGQKVNKSSSAVQLRFDVLSSPSLPEEVRTRLIQLAGRRLSEEGVLVIEAKRFRSQDRNRRDAIERLCSLIRKAALKPRRRRPTRPSGTARERRLREKKQRSALKKQRGRREFEGNV